MVVHNSLNKLCQVGENSSVTINRQRQAPTFSAFITHTRAKILIITHKKTYDEMNLVRTHIKCQTMTATLNFESVKCSPTLDQSDPCY